MKTLRHVLWGIYGVSIALVWAMSFIMILSKGGGIHVIASAIRGVVTAVYLTVLIGYVMHKAYGSRRVWRGLFWLNMAFYAISLGASISGVSHQVRTAGIIDFLFAAPLFYVLFRYSSTQNDIWNDPVNSKTAATVERA